MINFQKKISKADKAEVYRRGQMKNGGLAYSFVFKLRARVIIKHRRRR